jgi:hypothetical protein
LPLEVQFPMSGIVFQEIVHMYLSPSLTPKGLGDLLLHHPLLVWFPALDGRAGKVINQ